MIPAVGDSLIDWDLKGKELKDAIYDNFEALGLDGAVFTAGKSGKIPYGQLKKYYRNANIVSGGNNNASQTDTTISNKYEKFQYFYHPDHLGSSSYITDASGEVYQHFEYFPFGETFVEDRADHQRTPYLFNGKELDKETGLYYYGARYYDPRISLWYGVDPLAEENYQYTPYAYAFLNPLIIIDPDGRDGELVIDGDNLTVKVTLNYSKESLQKYNSKLGEYTQEQFEADFENYYESVNGEYEIDGEKYNVSFEINFNVVETDAEMPSPNNNDGTTNLTFDASKPGAGSHKSNVITLNSSPRGMSGAEDTGGSLSHEIIHALGVPDTRETTSGKLSSYSGSRNLQPNEVSIMLSPAINFAKQNNITKGSVLITHSRPKTGRQAPTLLNK